jgi:hypothetical protein
MQTRRGIYFFFLFFFADWRARQLWWEVLA